MKNDLFGTLLEWGTVTETLTRLRSEGTLDEHQSGLLRILRYRDNWRLREAALDSCSDLKRPEAPLVDQVARILLDAGADLDQRILAATALGTLIAHARISKSLTAFEIANVTKALDQLFGMPLEPVLLEAAQNAREVIGPSKQ